MCSCTEDKKGTFSKICTFWYRSLEMYRVWKMYWYISMVHFERSVPLPVGTNTISTRKKKSVHFQRSVLFGTDLWKCTDLAKCTFWLIGTFWKIGTFWYQSEKGLKSSFFLPLSMCQHIITNRHNYPARYTTPLSRSPDILE